MLSHSLIPRGSQAEQGISEALAGLLGEQAGWAWLCRVDFRGPWWPLQQVCSLVSFWGRGVLSLSVLRFVMNKD